MAGYNETASVTLDVLPGSMSGIAAVSAGMSSLVDTMDTLGRAVGKDFGALETMTIGAGTIAATGLAKAIEAAGDYEYQMKMVQVVSQQSGGAMADLSDQVARLGATYGTAFSDISEGLQTLGRAGLNSAATQTEVLAQGLQTAKLEGADLQSTLETLIQTTALFGGDLDSPTFSQDSEYINDLMVGTSMAAPIEVSDVAQTLQYSGGMASAAGANLEDEAMLEDYMGTIAAFAQKGVTGSVAGTALRAFFNKPTSQDSSVTEGLGMLGLSADALWEDGGEKMKPVSEQIGLIQNQMDKLNISTYEQMEIWSKIVGSKMGQQMLKLDSDDIKEMTSKVKENGSTAELANQLLDTYQGKLETVKSLGETAFRSIGEHGLRYMTVILDLITPLVEAFQNPYLTGVVFVQGIRLILAALKQVGTVISGVINSFRQLNTNISSITASTNRMNAALTQTEMKSANVNKNIGAGAAKSAFTAGGQSIVKTGSSFGSEITEEINKITVGLANLTRNTITTLNNVNSNIFGNLNKINTLVDSLFNNVTLEIGKLESIGISALNGLKNTGVLNVKSINSTFRELRNIGASTVDDININFRELNSIGNNVVNNISSGFIRLGNASKSTVDKINIDFGNISKTVSTVLTQISSKFTSISSVFNETITAITSIEEKGKESRLSIVRGAVSSISSSFKEAASNAVSSAIKIAEAFDINIGTGKGGIGKTVTADSFAGEIAFSRAVKNAIYEGRYADAHMLVGADPAGIYHGYQTIDLMKDKDLRTRGYADFIRPYPSVDSNEGARLGTFGISKEALLKMRKILFDRKGVNAFLSSPIIRAEGMEAFRRQETWNLPYLSSPHIGGSINEIIEAQKVLDNIENLKNRGVVLGSADASTLSNSSKVYKDYLDDNTPYQALNNFSSANVSALNEAQQQISNTEKEMRNLGLANSRVINDPYLNTLGHSNSVGPITPAVKSTIDDVNNQLSKELFKGISNDNLQQLMLWTTQDGMKIVDTQQQISNAQNKLTNSMRNNISEAESVLKSVDKYNAVAKTDAGLLSSSVLTNPYLNADINSGPIRVGESTPIAAAIDMDQNQAWYRQLSEAKRKNVEQLMFMLSDEGQYMTEAAQKTNKIRKQTDKALDGEEQRVSALLKSIDKDITDSRMSLTDKLKAKISNIGIGDGEDYSYMPYSGIVTGQGQNARVVAGVGESFGAWRAGDMTFKQALKNAFISPLQNFSSQMKSSYSKGGLTGALKTGLSGAAKGATSALGSLTSALGGPVMIALMAFEGVVTAISNAYEEHNKKIQEAEENRSEAATEKDEAEEAVLSDLVGDNADITEEEKQALLDEKYGEIQDTIESGNISALDKNTLALYAATNAYSQANERLGNTATSGTFSQLKGDDFGSLEGFSTYLSDSLGAIQARMFGSGEGYFDNMSGVLTASQRDENYAFGTDDASLLTADAMQEGVAGGLSQFFGESWNTTQIKDGQTGMVANKQGFKQWYQSLGGADWALRQNMGVISNAKMTPGQKGSLLSSMKNDTTQWKRLAKSMAQYEAKYGKGSFNKGIQKDVKKMSKDDKALLRQVQRLQQSIGAKIDKQTVLAAASLVQYSEMLGVAREQIQPTLESNLQTGFNIYGATSNAGSAAMSASNGAAGASANAAAIAALLGAQMQQQAYETAAQQLMADANSKNKVLTQDQAMAMVRSGVGNELLGISNEQAKAAQQSAVKSFGFMVEASINSGASLDEQKANAEKYYNQVKNSDKGSDAQMATLYKRGYNQIAQSIDTAYINSDDGSGAGNSGSGTGSGSGNGGSGSGSDSGSDTDSTKKSRVDLVLCNKKEIPKLNVNLFKKAPSFTVLNKNFKLRDIKVNTQDKPKAIVAAVKNAIIDTQKRADPKIIQDEGGEYDPVAATDGNSTPTGTTSTSADSTTES